MFLLLCESRLLCCERRESRPCTCAQESHPYILTFLHPYILTRVRKRYAQERATHHSTLNDSWNTSVGHSACTIVHRPIRSAGLEWPIISACYIDHDDLHAGLAGRPAPASLSAGQGHAQINGAHTTSNAQECKQFLRFDQAENEFDDVTPYCPDTVPVATGWKSLKPAS